LPPPTFVRLVRMDDEPAPLALRVGAVEIDVRAGFDAALLRNRCTDPTWRCRGRAATLAGCASTTRVSRGRN
jgi:hypothetical protein